MSYRACTVALTLFACLCLAPVSSALAQAIDLWTVTNVAVDATAVSPSAAKENALAKGRQKAWTDVFRRLTPTAEWSSQPPVADLELEPLVKSFDISGEKHSSTRYLATVTYVFIAAGVRAQLRKQGVRYSESTSKPVLFIALSGTAWQPESPWGHAWILQSRRGRLVPVAVPAGDGQDMATLAAVSSAADWGIVRPLADRYGAGSVMVASASSKATGGIQVSMIHIKPEGRVQKNSSFARQGTEDDSALTLRAAGMIADSLQEDWKRTTSVDFASQTSIMLVIPFRGLADWISIRKSLDATRLIQRVSVDEMDMSTAWVHLDYVGKIEQLQTALAQSNIFLTPDDKGNWTLSRNASNAAASSPNPVVP